MTIGLGNAPRVDVIRVFWTDGGEEALHVPSSLDAERVIVRS